MTAEAPSQVAQEQRALLLRVLALSKAGKPEQLKALESLSNRLTTIASLRQAINEGTRERNTLTSTEVDGAYAILRLLFSLVIIFIVLPVRRAANGGCPENRSLTGCTGSFFVFVEAERQTSNELTNVFALCRLVNKCKPDRRSIRHRVPHDARRRNRSTR